MDRLVTVRLIDELYNEGIIAQIAAENVGQHRPRVFLDRPVKIDPRRRLHLQAGAIFSLKFRQLYIGQCFEGW